MSEFQRIFSPRTEKAVKAISLLTNGAKYKPTAEEAAHTLDVLKSAVNDIAQLYGMLPAAKPAPVDPTSEQRVDEKKAVIKRSPFARGEVWPNVLSIPEDQLTAYATHIVARLCGRFEEPEAQPKNFLPKES